MTEYIEREDAIEEIMSEPPDAHYPHWYADKIKSIPAADVARVRHGRWVEKEKYTFGIMYDCSLCETAFLTTGIHGTTVPTAARRWIWSDNDGDDFCSYGRKKNV